MLRRKLGDQFFWKGVHNYVAGNLQKVVETDDFRRALEQVSGLNLNKFFDQWIYGRGYPTLKAEMKYNEMDKLVTLTFSQTQEDKSLSIGLFDFDLEVEVSFKNEEKKLVTLKFSDSCPRAVAVIAAPSNPTMIRVDPDMKVLFDLEFNPGEDILATTMEHASDIYNRIQAGKQLAKIGTKQSIAKISAAIAKEPFHGVRSALAKELAANKNIYTAQALADLIVTEKEPMALMHIINSCIGFRNQVIKQALKKLLERDDLPFLTHGRALQAYASQNVPLEEQDSLIDLIVQHIESDKRVSYPHVKRGGYAALGHMSDSKRVFDLLLNKLSTERHECRPIIAESLAGKKI